MNQNSRTAKSIKNSYVAMIFNFLNIIAQFVSRKIFLDYLGAEVLGLNMTVQNILQFLNLAELGISSAVSFTLYKPLRDGDTQIINEIITLQGQLYKRIAYFIILVSIVLLFFFPFIFDKINLPIWYAYAAFGVMLSPSLLSYFVNYKQIVLSASQQEYKIIYTFQTTKLIMVIVQSIVVYYLPKPYVWWLILQFSFSCLGSFFLHYITIKSFPYLENLALSFSKLRKKYPDITKKIKQVFFHKIGGFVLGQSTPILIYAYTSLNGVALYGNYLIITSGIMYIINSVFSSVNAGIGNLVAENNRERICTVFHELFSIRFYISTSVFYGVMLLTPSFVSIWIGKEYILPFSSLMLMALIMFIGMIRWSIDSFIYAYGLFGDIFSPLIEASINIVLSIVLGKIMGLNGVLLGALISLIIVICLWKPYYLFHSKLHEVGNSYIKMYILYAIAFAISAVVTNYIFNINSSYLLTDIKSLIIRGGRVFIVFTCILFSLLFVISNPFRTFVKRFIPIK